MDFPWSQHSLMDPATGSPRSLRLAVGPLQIRGRLRSGELHLHQNRIPTAPPREGATSGGEVDAGEPQDGWSRWALPGEVTHLRLEPALPDRPLVVKPEQPFRLLPEARARIFVRVPLWARVVVDPGPSRLLELPSVIMSDTWWGDPTDGELCYWWGTSARRAMEESLFEPHLAITVLQLENRSKQDLLVDKLSLRVEHLSLFRRGREIWSEETRVSYQGEAEGSEIQMQGRPPEEAAGAELMSPPRTPAPRGFRARTYARLLAMAPVAAG